MYSVKQAAEVLGVPSKRIQSCVRAGLLAPAMGEHGEPSFSFQDLVLLRAALGNGYLDAEFTTAELLVDPAARTARAKLQFATGQRYRFGPTTIEQNVVRQGLVRTVGVAEPDDGQERLLLSCGPADELQRLVHDDFRTFPGELFRFDLRNSA